MALARDQATPNKRTAHHEHRARRYAVVLRGPVPENMIDAVSMIHALAIRARDDAERERR